MRRLLTLSIVIQSLLLTACVQPINRERVDWDNGARYGRVLELLTPTDAAREAHDCLGVAVLPAGGTFVKLRYRRTRLHHTVVAAVPDGLNLHGGEEVELWPEDCAAGRLARVVRVLPALPAQP